MNKQGRNINGNNSQQGTSPWADTDILLKPEDQALFIRMGDYIKGYSDIEDVKSDPLYYEANDAAFRMISEFDRNEPRHKPYAKFISESAEGEKENEMTADEIHGIKLESSRKDIEGVTAEWVREWHEQRKRSVIPDANSLERENFIVDSLENTGNEPDKKNEILPGKVNKKSFILRFALPAAAAVAITLFLVKSLFPTHDPDRLYAKFYEPLSAVSPVTRSAESLSNYSYFAALGDYNNHNYQAAAAGFLVAFQKDTLNISSRFFMGLTQMELGNYNQSVNILEEVAGRQDEYLKEAKWYLGLAYLKTGNPEKASECFKMLSKSPGYYSGRAEKILRRLR
jgi:TolA-binding protein